MPKSTSVKNNPSFRQGANSTHKVVDNAPKTLNLRTLMLQKGSKCKCEVDDDIFGLKGEEYDEISMNSSQDHDIDR